MSVKMSERWQINRLDEQGTPTDKSEDTYLFSSRSKAYSFIGSATAGTKWQLVDVVKLELAEEAEEDYSPEFHTGGVEPEVAGTGKSEDTRERILVLLRLTGAENDSSGRQAVAVGGAHHKTYGQGVFWSTAWVPMDDGEFVLATIAINPDAKRQKRSMQDFRKVTNEEVAKILIDELYNLGMDNESIRLAMDIYEDGEAEEAKE